MTLNVAPGRALYALRGGSLVRIDSGAEIDPPPVAYSELFSTDTGGWSAKTNASDVIRDTGRYPGGALRWTPTANGDSSVRRNSMVPVTPSSTFEVTVKVSHSGSSGRGMQIAVDVYNASGGYSSSAYGPYEPTDVSASSFTFTHQFSTSATETQVRYGVTFHDGFFGEFAYLDEFIVVGPL